MNDDILLKLISDVKEKSNSNKVEVLAIDVKRDIPKCIHDENNIIKILDWLIEEMNRRYTIIHCQKCHNIFEYNKCNNVDNLSTYLVLVNNFQSIILNESKNINKIKKDIELLVQRARSVGIHVLLKCDKLNLFSEERA